MDVVIGQDQVELHYARCDVKGEPGEPIARLGPLGWSCTGNPEKRSSASGQLRTMLVYTFFAKPRPLEDLNQSLKRFWEIESVKSVPEHQVMSQEEKKGKLKWMKSLESLQHLVATSLQLKGHWSAPSGHLKLFKETSGSITIRYYSNTTSIIFQEDQGKKLENILLEKIASNQRSSEARLAANDDESVGEDPYSDQIESLTVQTTAHPGLNSDKTCTVNLSCLNDKTVEEDPYSDLNESLIVQTTADPNLNSGKTCIGNLSCVNEGLLAEASANETNRQNSTAMTCNSSQTNGDEPKGVPPRNANSVHSCSCQQLVNEMVTLKYRYNLKSKVIYIFF